MIYKHNGEITTLPKPPKQPASRMIRILGFLLTFSYSTIYSIIQFKKQIKNKNGLSEKKSYPQKRQAILQGGKVWSRSSERGEETSEEEARSGMPQKEATSTALRELPEPRNDFQTFFEIFRSIWLASSSCVRTLRSRE